jgi:O-acetylserine/cysteine efflux transporter
MKPLHICLLLLVVFFWGLNFVFVKIGLQEIPPILLCFFRFFLVSIPAICFFKRPALSFKWVVLYSLVMFVLQFALMFSGINAGVSAGLASILLQTQVFFSIFFASIILKEKLTLWQFLGALLSFSGIAIVGFNIGSEVSLPGLLLIITAAATWGAGSVIVKKMGKVQSASLLVWSSLLAWPPLLLLSLFLEDSHTTLLEIHQLSSGSYGAILFITLFSTVFGFGIWNWLVQLYPLATVAPFTLLVPVFAILSSTLFLNEPLESWKIVAALFVIGGLCLNVAGSRLTTARPIREE